MEQDGNTKIDWKKFVLKNLKRALVWALVIIPIVILIYTINPQRFVTSLYFSMIQHYIETVIMMTYITTVGDIWWENDPLHKQLKKILGKP
jgi:hypothetical protein